ncbi:reductive dehalogenase [Dehalogenimonas sp. 4OHTPN]|uniref:Reductive dehalogenase n=1 Tax=Dehalogenimonas sp. 4OHTPN TaxID=3166643 RepID=A0AAU8G8D1_9CHLR
MFKAHSTLSRREFMRAIGIAGSGLGAASLVQPKFNDVDELLSASSNLKYDHPWYAKEVDEPTVEVDWNTMQRFPKAKYNNFAQHLTTDEVKAIQAKTKADTVKQMTDSSKSGWYLRDNAIKMGGWAGVRYRMTLTTAIKDWVEGWSIIPTPAVLGVPKWQGSPEEASLLVTQALRLFGASSVGFAEILPSTTQKMVWGQMPQNPFPTLSFEGDAPKPVFDTAANKVVIPNTSRYAIVHTIRQSLDASARPGYLSDGAAGQAYDNCDIAQWRLQSFLRVMGYSSITQNIQGNGAIVGWGVMSGLGEQGRLQHLVTPRWGPMIRQSTMNIVDIPVAPTKPVDFGARRFCYTCKKCSDLCPSGAIPKETEPSWDITSKYDLVKPELFNNPGIKTWYFNHFKCNTTWQETDTYCGICQATCVFSKDDAASVHEIVKATLASTKILNSFFIDMDNMFGYGLTPEDQIEEWWQKPIPVNGIHYENDVFYK